MSDSFLPPPGNRWNEGVLDLTDPAYLQLFEDAPWQLDNGVLHDQDFELFRHCRYLAPVIMDIGANKGQSVASFLTIFPRASLHCFECNPLLLPVLLNLRDRRPEACRNLTIHEHGLSTQDGFVKFSTPIVDGRILLEETTDNPAVEFEKHQNRYDDYRAGDDQASLTAYQFLARVRRGDALALRPDIVKIDVEGGEPAVIAGLLDTITETLPLILAETSSFHEVNALLFPLGYHTYMAGDDGDVVPLSRGRANVLYIHPARHQHFEDGSLVPVMG